MSEKKYRVLWLDDHIKDMDLYVEALRRKGPFSLVHTASCFEEGVDLLNTNIYDLILADINMPAPNGVRFLREAEKLNPKSKLIALSSYLYRKKYIDQLLTLTVPVELMDKILPSPVSPEFDSIFIKHLVDILQSKHLSSVREQVDKAATINVDPFSVRLDDWLSKSALEKDKLAELAKQKVQEQLNEAFNSGIVWLMFCGSSSEFFASATSEEDIPTEDQIMDFARTRDAVPYRFTAPLGVEEFWGATCQGSHIKHDGYPTVTLDIPQDHSIQMHFDTGSPITFISYELLLRNRIISPPLSFDISSVNKFEYLFTRFDIEILLRSQQVGGQTKFIKLRGHAVRDWETHCLARKCYWSCKLSAGRQNELCVFRQGLIGRNIILDNELILMLDGKNRQSNIR